MTDVIIPTFSQEEYTVQCLKSIRECTPENNYRIIWVDNGSSADSRYQVMSELINHNYLTIWMGERLGFVRAINAGIRASKSEFVVFLNNDTRVTKHWLRRLKNPMLLNDEIMITGPNTTKATSRQAWDILKKDNLKFEDMPDVSNLSDEQKAEKLYEYYGSKWYSFEILAFFCAMLRREVFDLVGFLDEDYEEGYSDDVDFSFRVKKAGYTLAYVPSVYIHHYNRTTFLSLYEAKEISLKMQANKKLLNEKIKRLKGD